MSKFKSIVVKESKGTKTTKGNNFKDDHQSDDENRMGREKNKNNSLERLFCCHICGKTFLHKGNLKVHIRKHDGYRYICRIDMCYTFFTTKNSLNEHKLIHTGERPHLCKVCGKAFRERKTLRRHLRVHTGEKPHSCKECPKKFSQSHTLKEHMNIHAGVKPHVCELCQRAFTRKSDLRQHLKVHTKEKPFSCAHCAYKTSRKGDLKSHLNKCFKKHGFEHQFVLASSVSSGNELVEIE